MEDMGHRDPGMLDVISRSPPNGDRLTTENGQLKLLLFYSFFFSFLTLTIDSSFSTLCLMLVYVLSFFFAILLCCPFFPSIILFLLSVFQSNQRSLNFVHYPRITSHRNYNFAIKKMSFFLLVPMKLNIVHYYLGIITHQKDSFALN